jgi:hypothetical protein
VSGCTANFQGQMLLSFETISPKKWRKHWRSYQKDRIGRIFAYWLVVFFGKKFETIFRCKKCSFVLTKNGLGHILGDIFKNLFGHTGDYLKFCLFTQNIDDSIVFQDKRRFPPEN